MADKVAVARKAISALSPEERAALLREFREPCPNCLGIVGFAKKHPLSAIGATFGAVMGLLAEAPKPVPIAAIALVCGNCILFDHAHCLGNGCRCDHKGASQ